MKPTHLDRDGKARMVDVSGKPPLRRRAVAEGKVHFPPPVATTLRDDPITAKGDLLAVARIAGIQGGKKCSELIPLCHPLPLSHIGVDFAWEGDTLCITAEATTTANTGVEMEALTAVSIAALTVYDMAKALSREISIGGISLGEKTKESV
ncbi:cyclic pyranopterin monophosphate synthase MoaC [bacterium]|nr:cyclic pyranopterin monophosphate synthase MoaC [bacterium]